MREEPLSPNPARSPYDVEEIPQEPAGRIGRRYQEESTEAPESPETPEAPETAEGHPSFDSGDQIPEENQPEHLTEDGR